MLLARPELGRNECVPSYLNRVAHENGFRHMGYMLKHAGLLWKNSRVPVRGILSGEFDLSPYIQVLGLRPVKGITSDIYQKFERVRDTRSIFVRSPKICAECLFEDGYCSAKWAYLPVVACAKHACFLVDKCSSTGQRLSWYRPAVDKFDTSASVYASQRTCSEPAVLAVSAFFEAVLERRFSNVPSVLDGLEINDILTLFNFLAHYRFRLDGKRFKPASVENEILGECYADVWRIIQSWPDGLYDLFDQYKKAPMSSKGVGGVNKHFRDLTEAMHRQGGNKGIKVLRGEFNSYLETRWPGNINSDRTCRINVKSEKRDVITKKAAASLLDCRPALIDKYVKQKKLSIKEFKGAKYYSRSEVSALVKTITSNWTMTQASRELCLSPYQLRQLLEARVIPVIQRPDRLNRDWIIDKEQCKALIENLLKNAQNRLKEPTFSPR